MTPARKLALKKAQAISARRRKGTGKKKASSGGKRSVAAVKAQNVRRRRNVKRAAGAVAAVGAVAGAAYVYKNRERLIVAKEAERRAVSARRKQARRNGVKFSKTDAHRARMKERREHASRSTYRVREYKNARITAVAIARASDGKFNIRPSGRKGSYYDIPGIDHGLSFFAQNYAWETYRKDVYSRAQQRLAKIKGKKRGFNYDSGKRLKVSPKGKVTRMLF